MCTPSLFPKNTMPVFTYFSASKGYEIPLTEMENNHLNNAILKLQRAQDSGAPVPSELLDALKQEQGRRNAASQGVVTAPAEVVTKAEVDQQAATQPAAPPEPIHPAPDLGVLAASLVAVAQQITAGLIKPADLGDRLTKLSASVNNVILPGVSSAPNPVAVAVSPTNGSTLLVHLDPAAYPSLTSRYLLNSLASYGITTVAGLSTLSAVDFGAVRFSTAQAYAEASSLLSSLGMNWHIASSILLRDGFINPVLNPNASAIEVFVTEATARLARASAFLASRPGAEGGLPTIERIFSGIKRRLSLAASVVGTTLLARGVTSATASSAVNALNTSQAFKHQVRLYLSRVFGRVRQLYPVLPTTQEVPVSETPVQI